MRGWPPLERRHCVMIVSTQLSYAGGAPLEVLFNLIEAFDLQREARTCNILWHSSLTYVIRHQPNFVTLAPRCRLTHILITTKRL